jgi:hypothetical protein
LTPQINVNRLQAVQKSEYIAKTSKSPGRSQQLSPINQRESAIIKKEEKPPVEETHLIFGDELMSSYNASGANTANSLPSKRIEKMKSFMKTMHAGFKIGENVTPSLM